MLELFEMQEYDDCYCSLFHKFDNDMLSKLIEKKHDLAIRLQMDTLHVAKRGFFRIADVTKQGLIYANDIGVTVHQAKWDILGKTVDIAVKTAPFNKKQTTQSLLDKECFFLKDFYRYVEEYVLF